MAPVVFLLSALFPNQTKKPKPTHLDRIITQHLSEKQIVFVNIMVMKWLLRNKKQTRNEKKTQLLQFCSLSIVYFGEEEKG